MKNEISSRQTGIIIFLIFAMMKFVNLPSLLYQDYNESAFVIFVTLILIELITFVIVIYFIYKNKDISFYEYLTKKTGKIIAKLVYFIIFAYFLLRFIIFLGGNYPFLRDTIFSDAGLYFYLSIMIPILCSLAFSSQKAFSRTCEFLFLIVLFGFIACLGLGFFSGGFEIPYVSFDIKMGTFFKGLLDYNFWFGDAIVLLLFMENIKKDKSFRSKTIFFSVMSSIFLIIFGFCFFGVFPGTAFNHPYAIYSISIFAPRISSIGRLDIIPIITMMFFIILQSAIILRCATKSLEDLAEAKHEKNVGSILFSLLLSTIMLYLVFYSDKIIFQFLKSDFKWGVILIAFFLPMLLVFSFYKKRRTK